MQHESVESSKPIKSLDKFIKVSKYQTKNIWVIEGQRMNERVSKCDKKHRHSTCACVCVEQKDPGILSLMSNSIE